MCFFRPLTFLISHLILHHELSLLVRYAFLIHDSYDNKEILKKKTHRKMSQITWQHAIFTGASPDIVAADMLNFCVRDENRCVHIAIATRSL